LTPGPADLLLPGRFLLNCKGLTGSARAEGDTVPREQPLWYRLYYLPQYYELARILGYDALPVAEAAARARPLLERFGKETMDRVSRDMVHLDDSASPPTARLSDEARRLCRQLLGPPPDVADAS
jgi:hypothetical protein